MKATSDGDKMTQASGITVDESTKILNVEDVNNKEELAKKFDHLFEANDPKKGGSLYLQSKVIRARERIEMHWAQEKLKAEQAAEAEQATPAEKTQQSEPPSENSNKPQ
ncbi:mitochondrial import inner membrane translocase subunit TIM16 [Coemansia sp. RSA 2611]|nr:mitochondrial import inner membrane translocase subunit TIM16 [Coemansia sp. RSA 2705]KAJ2391522.1 mitochondrial import inner membrane translocase subunit TIM16 [Coemansia sp. RSA 2611]KAJ2737120.1 mitochondrial import inner membrane translocase subunit TIM16 [Coemansia sp. Cherry 401B]